MRWRALLTILIALTGPFIVYTWLRALLDYALNLGFASAHHSELAAMWGLIPFAATVFGCILCWYGYEPGKEK